MLLTGEEVVGKGIKGRGVGWMVGAEGGREVQ